MAPENTGRRGGHAALRFVCLFALVCFDVNQAVGTSTNAGLSLGLQGLSKGLVEEGCRGPAEDEVAAWN